MKNKNCFICGASLTALALVATTFTGLNELKTFGVNANLEPYKVDLVT